MTSGNLHQSTDTVDPATLFRLPWTAADNAMTWLEPTRKCNMTCDACFAVHDPHSEKSLEQIRIELKTMLRLRHCDAMLIAGGEPLTHPGIVDIVRMTKAEGVKPVIFTNGLFLDRPLLRELKRAGVHGFTFHVDAHQSRPGWTGKSESELNELRSSLADLLLEEGGLTCAFNITIFPDTLASVPDIVSWAVSRPDRVHILTFVCVRMADLDGPFEYFAGGSPVDFGNTPYVTGKHYDNLQNSDIYAQIKTSLPDFRFAAFLGGTVRPDSLKWAIGFNLSTSTRSYGSGGARLMEIIQSGYHAFNGRYLGYAHPKATSQGKLSLLLSVFDPELRRTARRYAATILRHPSELFRKLHVQNICVVQPTDILPNGEMDTCDGCPNKTYWKGALVSSCRLEEYRLYGGPVHAVPRREKEALPV
jgi:hypothetical protein